MKKTGIILVTLAALASPAVAVAVAADGASVERGKELFSSAKLGTSGKSCATCHPDGKNLESAAAYDEAQLAEIVNQCIKKPLKGNALDPGSTEMKSLIMYLRTFARPGRK